MQRIPKILVGTIAGIIACGFIGFGLGALLGDNQTGTLIGSLVGVPVGIFGGFYFSRN